MAKKELARFYTAPVKRFESARGAAPSATVIPTLRLRQEPPSRRRPDDDVEIVSSIEPGDALEQPYSDASVYRIPNPALDQKTLERLRPVFAAVAQRVYDAWEQDDDGEDPDYGVGGICDAIADAMCEVIDAHGGEAITVNSEGMGENHTWAVARCADGVFLVDIPPSVYETGGGYSWEKIPDVLFEADDVVIDELPEDAWDELADGY